MATVDLPTTNTSPTIHVMGEVDGIDSACNLVGTQLQCSLGRIRKNQSASITFDLELFECTLYPSSINSHPIEFHGNGTLSFPNASPDYTGAWEQLASDHLSMTYFFQGTPVAEFEGFGTSPGQRPQQQHPRQD